jgi:hypothetical protein
MINYKIFKISSAFVCYIMDHFEKGDLMTYLDDMRKDKEIVPFTVSF